MRDTWRIYRVATSAAGYKAWVDGALAYNGPPVARIWDSNNMLGYSSGSGGSYGRFGGQIAELIMLNRVSTDTEAKQMISYLNAEHGLAVPTG